jgi:SAC3 family protein LENG8/THP3
MIHTKNGRDLIQLIGRITSPGPNVQHAFHVRSAVASGDYVKFFQLYREAPAMSGYLMDNFIERERLKTLQKICRAYRPAITLNFIGATLGFDSKQEILIWLEKLQIIIQDDNIDCKSSVPILNNLAYELEAKGVDIKGQIH